MRIGGGTGALIRALLAHVDEKSILHDPDLTPDTLQRWRDAATCMALHAKFIATYARPFWREAFVIGATTAAKVDSAS